MRKAFSRRRFMRNSLTAAVAVLAYDPTTRLWASEPDGGSVTIPSLDGVLVEAGPEIAQAADDFGHIVSRAPTAVLIPGSVRDIESPPTLTDFLDLSVGGTLSVGGIGGQAFRHGLQVDNVLELQVVTGRGKLVTCSPEHKAELFHAVLAAVTTDSYRCRMTMSYSCCRYCATPYRRYRRGSRCNYSRTGTSTMRCVQSAARCMRSAASRSLVRTGAVISGCAGTISRRPKVAMIQIMY